MRTSITFGLITLVVMSSRTFAQTEFNVLADEKTPPRKMLHAYLITEAQKHFVARKAKLANLKSADDVRKHQAVLKARMIEALGGFPEKTPLNATVVGVEKRDGYRVERIIYESRPNHHVTANLYLPEGKGPFPAVIIPSGHDGNAKAAGSHQRMAIFLAKNGIACMPYDPIGQAERRQLLDAPNKAAIPSMTSEHTLIGVGALLVGQSTATFRIWDGIRTLDYLESRPEIDAKRLGCTGCSGGGTLTAYLMALDERIACAAPSCYITSLERLFATIGPQDAEQNITGQVALGIDHADYLTMRAPRPTLLATATQDFFDIHGSWATFRESTQIYGLMGHGERVNLVEFNTKHGYPKQQREAIARWMKRWLLNKDELLVEPEITTVKDVELLCTRSGQVLEDFKGKSAFHIIAEYEQKFAKERAAKLAKQTRPETLKEVRRVLGLPDQISAATVKTLEPKAIKSGKFTYTKQIYTTEAGIAVPAIRFYSLGRRGPDSLVVYVHGLGKTADLEAIENLLKNGKDVLTVDLRGMGETSPGTPSAKPSYFGADFTNSFLALHLNRPLLGQRVQDLLAIVAQVKTEKHQLPVHVIGVQAAGPIVLHAAAIDPRIESVTLDQSLVSWAAVTRSPINYNQLTNVVPGALKAYDLPDLATLVAPRPLTIREAWSPKWEPVTQAVLDETYASARSAYQKSGGKLTLVAGN